MLLLKTHTVDLSQYPHKAKKNWVCRCNILLLMEHDKTLLFRHCEKCKNKFTKLKERVGSSQYLFGKNMTIFFHLLVNILSPDLVQKVDECEPPFDIPKGFPVSFEANKS